MSDDSTINFDVAEKYSYVYADEKFGKLAVAATGDAKLVDPLAWSYAETHSYVKVDPSSLGVSVPSGITEIYAKVIYAPGIGGGGGSSSPSSYHTHKIADITNLNTILNSLSSSITINSNLASANSSKINSLSSAVSNEFGSIGSRFTEISDSIESITTAIGDIPSIPTNVSEFTNDAGYATTGYVDEKVSAITIPTRLSDLENDKGFAASSYVDEKVAAVIIPTNLSEFTNDAGYATTGYVDEKFNSVVIPTNISEFANDSEYATSAYVDEKVAAITIPTQLSEFGNDLGFVVSSELENVASQIPSNVSDLENDADYVTSAQMQESIEAIIIPKKNSELENDTQYVALSTVQQMIMTVTNSFNQRIAKLESQAPSGETNLGDREDELNMFEGDDRASDTGFIIDYSDRVPPENESNEMTMQELAEMYNQRIARLEARSENAVVDLGEHSYDLDNLNIDDRTSSDTQTNGIIFENRI